MEPSQLTFTRLWLMAQPVVHSLLVARLGDRMAVDDVAQEVALAAFQRLESYDDTRSFTAWALGIAHHKATDWLRLHGPRRLVITDEQALATLIQVGADMERELHDREFALHGCLEVLQGRARDVIHLFYIEEKSVHDISSALEMSVSHVKVMLHRVREALRDCVGKRLASEQR
jgi:RNA polymerase sigma-70 factor (ECF subfamily)